MNILLYIWWLFYILRRCQFRDYIAFVDRMVDELWIILKEAETEVM
jgi:hypothetical protein